MPIITVWGLSEISERRMIKLYENIQEAVVFGIKELELMPKDVTVLFPPDKMAYGLGDEIIVFVDGLFEKPERTDEVRSRLAEKIGKEIKFFFERHTSEYEVEKPPIKMPKSIEVFIRPFNPKTGFWLSQGSEK